MTTNVIIAHYNEDLTWVKNINPIHNIFIYSKTNKHYNFIEPNKGNEISCYLKYIIDNYDRLGDKNLFLHAHRNSYHQTEPADYIVNNINWNLSDYFSVTRRDWYFHEGVNIKNHTNDYLQIKQNWNSIFSKNIELPHTFHHYSCAQFQVNKDNILKNGLTFYKNAYNWIMSTPLPCSISGRVFEHIWHFIFTGSNIETVIDNIYKK